MEESWPAVDHRAWAQGAWHSAWHSPPSFQLCQCSWEGSRGRAWGLSLHHLQGRPRWSYRFLVSATWPIHLGSEPADWR